MRVALGCCLYTGVALLACGHQLRGMDDVDPKLDPKLDPYPGYRTKGFFVVAPEKYLLQESTAEAKISALKVKTVVASNVAKAAADQANTQRMKAEEIYLKTQAVLPELQTIKKVARKEAASANEASKEGKAIFKSMQKEVKTMADKSKILAVQEVKTMMRKKYHQLSEWRHQVLTNPWEKSQVAAAKAAVPYFKQMGSFVGSINSWGLEASTMRSESAAVAANAKSLEDGWKQKKDAGDVIGAQQDYQMSKALDTQSKQLAARAVTLDKEAANMREIMPRYAQAAHMAAWNAEFSANPDGLPPPPVDPNFAFASPESPPK